MQSLSADRARHLENALQQYDAKGNISFGHFLRLYLDNHDSLKASDKSYMTAKAYDLMRWKGLLDYVCKTPPNSHNWSLRMKT